MVMVAAAFDQFTQFDQPHWLQWKSWPIFLIPEETREQFWLSVDISFYLSHQDPVIALTSPTPTSPAHFYFQSRIVAAPKLRSTPSIKSWRHSWPILPASMDSLTNYAQSLLLLQNSCQPFPPSMLSWKVWSNPFESLTTPALSWRQS